MDAGVVLVAAGEGRRFGGPKAFLDLEGVPLLRRAAAPFARLADRVVVVRRADLERAAMPGWKVVAGGARRRDSVALGVAALDPGTAIVLVHDAARPLVTEALVDRVAAAARQHAAVVPVVPLHDTIKRVQAGRVLETLDRASLVAVQTPQAFRADLLRRALARTDADATDEAALVEALGETVATVPGDPRNVKITTPEDLPLIRALLGAAIR
jgi:2-C-methyl-D-erythritol 4-phosphate cytidylyltransferase